MKPRSRICKGRPFAPSGAAWDKAVARGERCRPTPTRKYDKSLDVRRGRYRPAGDVGHESRAGHGRDRPRAAPGDFADATDQKTTAQSLEYMGLAGGEAVTDLKLDRVFIGSCTNARIEDLRAAAAVAKGKRVASHVQRDGRSRQRPSEKAGRGRGARPRLPRSRVRLARGRLQHVPGDEPRQARPGERCASTSNRNFEGRQGKGGRTHLVSPAMAAAAAVAGHFVDVREWN